MPATLPACGLVQLSAPDSIMGSAYDKAISFRELYKGLKASARNVRWKDSVAAYDANSLKNTWKLRQQLLADTYAISPYQRFMIHEPKERPIVATRIKDRQFQRSLCDNVLYDQITRGFIRDNCACLRGRGVDDALSRMDAHLHRYFRKHGADGWVLKCDIRHYFAETAHDVAKAAICKRVTDRVAAARACEIIDSFGGDKGIGLGSQVSQLTELAVLDDLDHYIKERLRIRHYVRYMDDFVLIHHDRATLENALVEIRKRITAMGLTLNAKTQIFPLRQGLVFLKWRFILTDTGKVVRRMSKASISKQRRKLRKLKAKIEDPQSPLVLRDAENSIQAWVANAQRGDTRAIVRKMLEYYNQLYWRYYHGQHQGKRQPPPGQGNRQGGSRGEALRGSGAAAGAAVPAERSGGQPGHGAV